MSADIKSNSPTRTNVSIAAIGVAAIALIAFLGFLGYQMFTPKVYAPPIPENAPKPGAAQAGFQTWAKQKYQETGGDWSKVAKQDQQRFMDASRGKGKAMFESFK